MRFANAISDHDAARQDALNGESVKVIGDLRGHVTFLQLPEVEEALFNLL